MPDQNELGLRIREVRRGLGLSQAELAGNELSTSYVSLIEAGKRTPTPAVLSLIGQRLGTSAEFLRDGIEPATLQELALRLSYANLSLENGEAEEALRHFEGLLDDTAIDLLLHTQAVEGRGRALEALGRLEEAIVVFESLTENAARDPKQSGYWAAGVIALCRCYKEVGDLGRAIDLGERAVSRLAELELLDTDEHAQLVSTLAHAYLLRGDRIRAQLLVTGLISRVDLGQSRKARGAAYWNASLIAESGGRIGEAVALAERALAMYSEGGDERSIARLKVANAWLLTRLPGYDTERARVLVEQARAELLNTGTAVDVAYCDTELARLQLADGHVDEALETARSALERLGDHRVESGRAWLVLGKALCSTGEIADARRAFDAADAALIEARCPREAAGACREAADALAAAGETEAALLYYQRALASVGIEAASMSSVLTIPSREAARELQPASHSSSTSASASVDPAG